MLLTSLINVLALSKMHVFFKVPHFFCVSVYVVVIEHLDNSTDCHRLWRRCDVISQKLEVKAMSSPKLCLISYVVNRLLRARKREVHSNMF